jgi:hypothetical protein
MIDREAAKLARPPSDEEPWVVADDTGLRVTFRSEGRAWQYRDQYTDRLVNPTVTHEPATAGVAVRDGECFCEQSPMGKSNP